MQWTSGKQAGFSTAASTWLSVEPNFKSVNVATEEKQKDSLLQWYKDLIELRRTNLVIIDGEQATFNAGNDRVVAYTRSLNGSTILVLNNFSGTSQNASLDAFAGKKLRSLKANFASTPQGVTAGSTLTLPAYGSFIGEVN